MSKRENGWEGERRREREEKKRENKGKVMRRWDEPVLVNEQDIEPILRVLRRPIQIDPPIDQLIHEAIVPDIPHPIQRELCVSLLQEDGFDFEAVFERFDVVGCLTGELHAAEVVDEAGGGEDVEGAEGSFLRKRDKEGGGGRGGETKRVGARSETVMWKENAPNRHLEGHRGCRESRKPEARR